MRADFVEVAFFRATILLPELMEPLGEDFSEDGADGDASDEVALLRDNRFSGAGVVAVNRMIEALSHVVLKGKGAVLSDFFDENPPQVGGCPIVGSRIRKGTSKTFKIGGTVATHVWKQEQASETALLQA